jgi:hypothetical protein
MVALYSSNNKMICESCQLLSMASISLLLGINNCHAIEETDKVLAKEPHFFHFRGCTSCIDGRRDRSILGENKRRRYNVDIGLCLALPQL